MILLSRKMKVSLGRIYAYYQIGKFYNLILPTSMGGDIVRIYELGKYTGRRADTVASVFVERFTGLVTLTFVAFCAVIINLQTFNNPLITGTLLFCIVVIATVSWLVMDDRPLKIVNHFSISKIPYLTRIFSKIKKVHLAVGDYRNDPATLWIAILNSMVFNMLAVVNVWVSVMVFEQDVSFASILIAVPVILLLMNLPISIGGIGLMEFAYVFTFEVVGYSSTLGLSTALLMRMKTFIDGGLGGLIHFFYFKENNTASIFDKAHEINARDDSQQSM